MASQLPGVSPTLTLRSSGAVRADAPARGGVIGNSLAGWWPDPGRAATDQVSPEWPAEGAALAPSVAVGVAEDLTAGALDRNQ